MRIAHVLALLLALPAVAWAELTPPERQFVEQVAADHLAEIDLARLALEKSQTLALRNQAQLVVDDDEKSLERLRAIARDQNLVLPTQPATNPDRYLLSRLQGDSLDRALSQQLHQKRTGLITTIQQARLENPDLQDFANQALQMAARRR